MLKKLHKRIINLPSRLFNLAVLVNISVKIQADKMKKLVRTWLKDEYVTEDSILKS